MNKIIQNINKTDFFLIIMLALLSIVFQGHDYGTGTHSIYLPSLIKITSTEFFKYDWYLNTPITHPNILYPTAWLSKYFSYNLLFFILHLLTRILFCYGVFLLALNAFNNKATAYLSIIANILFPRITLGGHFAQASHFEANFIGFSLAIIAIANMILIKRKAIYLYIAAFFIGLTLIFHFFVGLPLLAIFLIYIIFLYKKEVLNKEVLLSFLIIFIMSLREFAINGYTFFTQQKILNSAQVSEILAFRHPHHHSPFMWPANSWLIFGYYFIFWLILRRKFDSKSKFLENVIIYYVLITSIIHTIFVEIYPVGLIAFMQSFRQTVLFTVFISIYFAHFLNQLYANKSWKILLALLLLITFRTPAIFIPLSLVLLILTIKIPYKIYELPESFKNKPKHAFVMMLMSVILIILCSNGTFDPIFSKMGRDHHFKRDVYISDKELSETYDWIKNNTDKDAVFLIPPSLETFRTITLRACVVDYTSIPFTNKALWEWFDRISRICKIIPNDISKMQVDDNGYSKEALDNLQIIRRKYQPLSKMDTQYKSLSQSEIKEICQRYGAKYILGFADVSYSFNSVFKNEKYAVYKLDNTK